MSARPETDLSPDEDVLGGLHIAEGIETALAAMSKGFRPMWATGSDSIMAKFPLLGGIEALTIIADRDVNGAGERAAREVAARWLERIAKFTSNFATSWATSTTRSKRTAGHERQPRRDDGPSRLP